MLRTFALGLIGLFAASGPALILFTPVPARAANEYLTPFPAHHVIGSQDGVQIQKYDPTLAGPGMARGQFYAAVRKELTPSRPAGAPAARPHRRRSSRPDPWDRTPSRSSAC